MPSYNRYPDNQPTCHTLSKILALPNFYLLRLLLKVDLGISISNPLHQETQHIHSCLFRNLHVPLRSKCSFSFLNIFYFQPDFLSISGFFLTGSFTFFSNNSKNLPLFFFQLFLFTLFISYSSSSNDQVVPGGRFFERGKSPCGLSDSLSWSGILSSPTYCFINSKYFSSCSSNISFPSSI
ncbi:hypothetical protein EDC16_103266 [Testudinibacter aquarius]|uniref:Uncharacterized protein n=1 Tax=Testudinibacter aquarius TaxID=1524974 RepID=A0A4R3YA85_9PAST|nr:hypothetical protein EDC16_103266 [Testudinibacter aquarius]